MHLRLTDNAGCVSGEPNCLSVRSNESAGSNLVWCDTEHRHGASGAWAHTAVSRPHCGHQTLSSADDVMSPSPYPGTHVIAIAMSYNCGSCFTLNIYTIFLGEIPSTPLHSDPPCVFLLLPPNLSSATLSVHYLLSSTIHSVLLPSNFLYTLS